MRCSQWMTRVLCLRKDFRADNKSKVMTLNADEFIRRFLLHVLPKGFRRAAKLARIRAALQAPEPPPPAKPVDYRERYAILTGHRLDLCPVCGGRLGEIGLAPRSSTLHLLQVEERARHRKKGRKLQDDQNSFTPSRSERICGRSWWPL